MRTTVCESCATEQALGSGVIVCKECGVFGLLPIFPAEGAANDAAGDRPVAFVSDPTGGAGYWIIDHDHGIVVDASGHVVGLDALVDA